MCPPFGSWKPWHMFCFMPSSSNWWSWQLAFLTGLLYTKYFSTSFTRYTKSKKEGITMITNHNHLTAPSYPALCWWWKEKNSWWWSTASKEDMKNGRSRMALVSGGILPLRNQMQHLNSYSAVPRKMQCVLQSCDPCIAKWMGISH